MNIKLSPIKAITSYFLIAFTINPIIPTIIAIGINTASAIRKINNDKLNLKTPS